MSYFNVMKEALKSDFKCYGFCNEEEWRNHKIETASKDGNEWLLLFIIILFGREDLKSTVFTLIWTIQKHNSNNFHIKSEAIKMLSW